MKTITTLLLLAALCIGYEAQAQVSMTLINNSNCDLTYTMYERDASNCGTINTVTYFVAAGGQTMVTAQTGYQWWAVVVTQNSLCMPGSGALLVMGSDGLGCSNCPSGLAQFDGAQTLGCGSCQRGIDGDYDTCGGTVTVY